MNSKTARKLRKQAKIISDQTGASETKLYSNLKSMVVKNIIKPK